VLKHNSTRCVDTVLGINTKSKKTLLQKGARFEHFHLDPDFFKNMSNYALFLNPIFHCPGSIGAWIFWRLMAQNHEVLKFWIKYLFLYLCPKIRFTSEFPSWNDVWMYFLWSRTPAQKCKVIRNLGPVGSGNLIHATINKKS
jgi:hypothetical protein